ncbi:MAG: DNRLRE domain-containing protein, partial [Acidobacteriota bacterium]
MIGKKMILTRWAMALPIALAITAVTPRIHQTILAGFVWSDSQNQRELALNSRIEPRTEHRHSLIVQAQSTERAAAAVRRVGGEITHELGVIQAVAARLNAEQLQQLGDDVRTFGNHDVQTASFDLQLTATADTYIDSDDEDDNKGDKDDLKLEADEDDQQRVLLRFDLCDVPAGATVISATLRLYVSDEDDGEDLVVGVHRLTRGWAEGDGDDDYGADWEHHDDPGSWDSQGGDYDPVAFGWFTPDDDGEYYDVDLTQLVQLWADGTYANEGVILVAEGDDDEGEARIGSRENPGREPLLEIRYAGGNPASVTCSYATGAGGLGNVTRQVAADRLHRLGVDGSGVTVAVLDSGWWHEHSELKRNRYEDSRILAEYNAVEDRLEPVPDKSGHGTHVTSVLLSSRTAESGLSHGIAPNANLVQVRAFGEYGVGTYADVIRGLDWIIAQRDVYDIRV